MTTPVGLLGATVLFWGLQTGLLVVAAVLALALEGARLVKKRWDVSQDDFIRVTDGATLLLAGLIVYAYSTRPTHLAIMTVLSWMPAFFAPVFLAQALSSRGAFSVSVLFWSLRRRARQGEAFPELNLSWPYFLVSILACAAANVRTPAFYLGMFLLASWALLAVRPRTSGLFLSGTLLAAAGAIGVVGQAGLHALQGVLEREGARLIFGIVEVGADPYQSRTAIGSIGSLLQSDLIVLRVKPLSGPRPPDLLRRASYSLYRAGTWHAGELRMTDLASSGDGRTWDLAPEPAQGSRAVLISSYLRRGQGLLALPAGTFRVEGLLAGSVSHNRFGAVQVDQGPGMAAYRAIFGPESPSPSGLDKTDLLVPAGDASLMTRLGRELGLDPRKPEEALAKVSRFFEQGFTYSTYQEAAGSGEKPLERFLLKTRSGHCEFFATATTLLLRGAGIPARYCVGWSVQEHSRLENAFIVRQRHAHAWVLVHAKGAWRDFDTTPSTWAAVESSRAPWWGPARDVWSWIKFQAARLRWESLEGKRSNARLWLGMLAALGLGAWKLLNMRAKAASAAGAQTARVPGKGLDSEFYLIESALAREGWGRRPSETWRGWLKRIEAEGGFPVQELSALAALHERYRFDPQGLRPEERKSLAREALRLARSRQGLARQPPAGAESVTGM
ncbi:MAG: DUF4129 domain-containing protein [Elusimicrobia bacterium]|nr:DUF4129 domain-containing protein [Elusimicrobiota bacterium]